MLKQPVNLILVLLFLYPIIKGFIFKFSSRHLKRDIESVFHSISFLVSLCLGIYFTKKVFIQHNEEVYEKIYNTIPLGVLNYINNKPLLIYVLIMPLVVLIIYNIIKFIISIINNITFYPLLDSIEHNLKEKSNFYKRFMGAIFQFPKAICYVIVFTFILNFVSLLNIGDTYNGYIKESEIYNFICKEVVVPLTNSNVAKKLPSIVDNSFKIVIKESNPSDFNSQNRDKIIVYYNGVTLEEGVKSNEEIDAFAINLVKGKSSTAEKSKDIYNWVGNKITYDDEKANRVLNNDLEVKSGAIPTYYSKKGICFDYACLFAAMCRANDIKVRIITGQGFNGNSWVSHAWNQVYLQEENRWINVDSTFLIGGDYFDSKRFIIDHKEARIAGEW